CRSTALVWQNARLSPAPVHLAAVVAGTRRHEERTRPLKSDIHPQYVQTQVHCGCGNSFTTRSTRTSGNITVEICSNCHPFYTGKQKILDTGGRVARFEARYGRRPQG